MIQSRRGFLRGLGGFVACAPAIVRASSLMAVRGFVEDGSVLYSWNGFEGVVTGESLGEQLASITRRAFVPSVYVQIYERSPLAEMLDATL